MLLVRALGVLFLVCKNFGASSVLFLNQSARILGTSGVGFWKYKVLGTFYEIFWSLFLVSKNLEVPCFRNNLKEFLGFLVSYF